MARPLVLAIDQGTTNTKALVFDQRGAVVARASRPVPIRFPRPAWVEQDLADLWRTAAEAAADCVSAVSTNGGGEIAAIGIANQRESVALWERATSTPAGPSVVWQCRRSAPFCAGLRLQGAEPLVRARTGLGLDPLFSAGKLRWLIEQASDGRRRAERGELCAGTVDTWLLWNLTGGAAHSTDATNASRTQLMNLAGLDWDEEMLRLFGIPPACLAAIHPSSHRFAVTAAASGLPAGIPVAAMAGDSHAALFGHGAFAPGTVKATYGTGSSLMTATPGLPLSQGGLSATVAWWVSAAPQFALEGNITSTGATVEWLGRLLGFADPAAQIAGLADGVETAGGVSVVPAFAGLGAPYWDENARALICGLTRGSTAAQVARAAVDSIAFQVADVFFLMEREAGIPLPELRADGGACRNHRLMQFQADILGRPVLRSDSPDLAARGAAWMAGLATGVWRNLDELAELVPAPASCDRFEPRLAAGARQRLLDQWREAVGRALSPKSETHVAH
ncbi:MAG: FGGY family carbohydrate kinase [Bryobacteraceae bacterium]|jgi:glycerol kinase